jgi:diguanylate cyclase (GGDEF)-like protein
MERIDEFFRLIVDSIPHHIVVIDESGIIRYVNQSWTAFARENSCSAVNNCKGLNYLAECDKAGAAGDAFGANAGKGIRSVIYGEKEKFYLEYPCHSPKEKRWFMMDVTPFIVKGYRYFIISHQDITQRKLAEEQVENAAKRDGLTGIFNRRSFDEFLNSEWRRCLRLKKPISVAMVDIDHFKALNDTYGHPKGDECLVKVAGILDTYAKRPGDLCARYGGEEFIMIWGDTPLEKAKNLVEKIRQSVADLNIPNKNAPGEKTLTISIGLTTVTPAKKSAEKDILEKADKLLYKAKENGRNRIETG